MTAALPAMEWFFRRADAAGLQLANEKAGAPYEPGILPHLTQQNHRQEVILKGGRKACCTGNQCRSNSISAESHLAPLRCEMEMENCKREDFNDHALISALFCLPLCSPNASNLHLHMCV